jgi:hypothetical protein
MVSLEQSLAIGHFAVVSTLNDYNEVRGNA